MDNKIIYVVSACLAGLNCRYDGGSNPCWPIVEMLRQGRVAPICPEGLSGLPCPRPPCEQKNGKVLSCNGADLTGAFEKGAELALAAALATGCRRAILKARSPSCGLGRIYDGSFGGVLRPGNGVWTKKLMEAGFEVFDEENLPPDVG